MRSFGWFRQAGMAANRASSPSSSPCWVVSSRSAMAAATSSRSSTSASARRRSSPARVSQTRVRRRLSGSGSRSSRPCLSSWATISLTTDWALQGAGRPRRSKPVRSGPGAGAPSGKRWRVGCGVRPCGGRRGRRRGRPHRRRRLRSRPNFRSRPIHRQSRWIRRQIAIWRLSLLRPSSANPALPAS